jgi:hypothetical protein
MCRGCDKLRHSVYVAAHKIALTIVGTPHYTIVMLQRSMTGKAADRSSERWFDPPKGGRRRGTVKPLPDRSTYHDHP